MLNIPTVSPEKIFEIAGFPITNTLLLTFIVSTLLILAAVLIKFRLSSVPKGLQNVAEFFVESLISATEGIFGSKKEAEKYLPFIATIFILVLVSNWLGILPGVGALGIYEEHEGRAVLVPIFRSASSDLNFTLALAVITVLAVNVLGIISIGAFKHIGKFISFKSPISFFVGILELISEIARMVSFSFRLFGNVFAGEVMLVIAAFFVPYIVPIPLLAFEIFVGFIQAAVFAMLAAVFIGISVQHHEEAH